MNRNNILFLIIGLLLGLIVIKAGPMIIMGFNTMNVTLTADTGNTGPSVDTVTLDDADGNASTVTLSSGSTTTVWCNATLSDPNGGNDISSATANVYYYMVGGTSTTPDYNNRYYGAMDLSSTYDTTKKNASVAFNVYYQASPGQWLCNVTVTDASSEVDSLTDDVTFNELNSLDTDSTINFGALTVGVPSSEITHAVRNWGNIMIDLALNGTDMTCSTLGSIPVANVKYNVSQSGIAYGSMTALSTVQTTSTHFNLVKKTANDTTTNSSKDTYWRVQAPSGAKGTCTGTAQFTSVSGEYTIGSPTNITDNNTIILYSQNPTTGMYYEVDGVEFRNSTDGITWSDPVEFGRGGQNAVRIQVTSNGSLITTLQNQTDPNDDAICALSSDDGTTWTIDTSCGTTGSYDRFPSMAVAPNGVIHLVWDITNLHHIWYRNSTDNGATWATMRLLVSGAGLPNIIADSNSNLYLFYIADNRLKMINSTTNGTSWSSEVNLTTGAYIDTKPYAAIDNAGTVWVFYLTTYNTYPQIFYLRSYDNATTWDVPKKLISEDHYAASPSVAKMNDGNLWLTYRNYTLGGDFSNVVKIIVSW